MRVVWVVVISILMFCLGTFGGCTGASITGMMGAMKDACDLAKLAETEGFVNKDERNEIWKKFSQKEGDQPDFDSFCATLTTK